MAFRPLAVHSRFSAPRFRPDERIARAQGTSPPSGLQVSGGDKLPPYQHRRPGDVELSMGARTILHRRCHARQIQFPKVAPGFGLSPRLGTGQEFAAVRGAN